MNVILFYGNGFDRSLKLRTSYSTMVDNRLKEGGLLPFEDRLFRWFRSRLETDNWCNLELMLGDIHHDIYQNADVDQAYVQALHYVHTNLFHLLKQQMKIFRVRADARRLIETYLVQLLTNCRCYDGKQIGVLPLTLNYTDTLERILQNGVESKDCLWHSVVHLHGRVEDASTVVGLDNRYQFSEKIRMILKSADQILIKKPKQEIINIATTAFHCAEVAIFYGVSFGETDLRWWKLIGECVDKTDLKAIVCLHPQYSDQSYSDAKDELRHKLIKRGWSQNSVSKVQFPPVQATPKNAQSFGDYLGLCEISAL